MRLKDMIACMASQVPTTDFEETWVAGVNIQDLIPILHFFKFENSFFWIDLYQQSTVIADSLNGTWLRPLMAEVVHACAMRAHNTHSFFCECCFVLLNRYWVIVTVSGFHHERAKGDARVNRRHPSSSVPP